MNADREARTAPSLARLRGHQCHQCNGGYFTATRLSSARGEAVPSLGQGIVDVGGAPTLAIVVRSGRTPTCDACSPEGIAGRETSL